MLEETTKGVPAVERSRTKALARNVAMLRIAFGIIWAIDAAFKWAPAFQRTYLSQVEAASEGQPHWLLWLYHTAEHVIAVDPHAFAVATAVVESLTAVGLIVGFARRVGYWVGLGFSLMVWALAEGFGGPYTAGATDIGTGIIYAVVFAALYGLDRLAGANPWALDYWIAKRWPVWRPISDPASVDPPNRPAP